MLAQVFAGFLAKNATVLAVGLRRLLDYVLSALASFIDSTMVSPATIPITPLPLYPAAETNGFMTKKCNNIIGTNHNKANLTSTLILMIPVHLGQVLGFPNLFNAFENKPIFSSQCGHFIESS